jgi:uncharacterized protein (DUF488 family)
MATDEFRSGIRSLESLAGDRPTTVMCAEAVPWRCHRSLLADALVARGNTVLHVLDAGVRPHVLTSFAAVERGEVRYLADGQRDLFAGAADR